MTLTTIVMSELRRTVREPVHGRKYAAANRRNRLSAYVNHERLSFVAELFLTRIGSFDNTGRQSDQQVDRCECDRSRLVVASGQQANGRTARGKLDTGLVDQAVDAGDREEGEHRGH